MNLIDKLKTLKRYHAEPGYACSDTSCCGDDFTLMTEAPDGDYIRFDEVEELLMGDSKQDSIHITVNMVEHEVPDAPISYETIAEFEGHPGAKWLTVVYHGRAVIDGERYEKSGTLIPGESVKPLDGMHFTAVHTGNA